MKIQLSSGLGPVECRIAVGVVLRSLQKEFTDLKIISCVKDRDIKDSYASVILESNEDLSSLAGTIQCIFESPIRKGHKRKNWFIQCSLVNNIDLNNNISNEDFKVSYLHSGGKGGQNINKVETGVRVTYIPLNLTVTCTEERTQFDNKRKAFERINQLIKSSKENKKAENKKNTRDSIYDLERGNPVRTYIGLEGKLRN